MQEEPFETVQGELVSLRRTLEDLMTALMSISNKVYRAESKIKLLSKEASGSSQEDSPPQKKAKSCSPIWLPQG